MAKQSVRFEYDLHEQVIVPMQDILSEIKKIELLKKKLTNARLDVDSANNSLQKRKAHRGIEAANDLLANAENATNQFQMAQDTYITALLSFSSKELDHVKPLQCLLSCQQRMYNDVSKILNAKLPGLQDNIEKNANTPVFGTDLERHLENTGKPIASVLHKCCTSLLKSGIEQPGIFRLAGGLPQLRKLKAMFDSNRMDEEEWEHDVFTLAQAIKLYLRELPEPLLTFAMFEDWISCIGNPKVATRIPRCKELVDKLPNAFQTNLQYLIWFLSQVAAKEPENKMGASNLGLVLGPNVLRSEGEDDNDSITALNASSALVELMIKNYSTMFPNPLPVDTTYMSLPRAMTAISSSRPSVRSHKKGKAPTPKRVNAPAPPPRVDLNKSGSAPALNTTPAKPATPDPAPTATPAEPSNPFDSDGGGDEDVDKTPDPPKRKIEGKTLDLDSSIPIPAQEQDDNNPFNSPTPDSPITPLNLNNPKDNEPEALNPFGSDSESASAASPEPPAPAPAKAPQSPPRPHAPTSVAAAKPTPPPKPKSASVSDDKVSLEGAGSPIFTKATHSRNASNSSMSSDGRHSRTPSDQSKPAPPPRPSLEQ